MTPRQVLLEKEINDQRVKKFPLVVVGPCFGRDDRRDSRRHRFDEIFVVDIVVDGAKVESGLVESVIGLRLP